MTNLLTVLISGLFGLLVALVTFWLTSKKESSLGKLAAVKERRARTESLYAAEIALIEKIIRYVEAQKDYTELIEELSKQNAHMQLGASARVLESSSKVSAFLQAWSSEYAQGSPSRVSGSNFAIISSMQSPHREKAKELHPKMIESIEEMIACMKKDLEEIK